MQTLNENISIDTPENVAFGYAVAGIGSRFLAALADTAILILLIAGVWIALLIISLSLPQGLANPSASSLFLILGSVLSFLVFWGYYIFFELAWNGQTPGKRWVGLRVVRQDGAPVTLVEAIIRNLVRIIDFLPTFYGIGLLVIFFNAQARRLGDLAAGTLVIYDRGVATIESVGAALSAGGPVYIRHDTPLDLAGLNTSLLSPRTIELAETFLRRRHQVGNQQELALQVQGLIEKELGGPIVVSEGLYSATDQIAAVINAYRSRKPSAAAV